MLIMMFSKFLFKNIHDKFVQFHWMYAFLTFQTFLFDEARLVTGEEGCVCNIDIEMIENEHQSGLIDSNQVSSTTKEKISILIDQVLEAIT